MAEIVIISSPPSSPESEPESNDLTSTPQELRADLSECLTNIQSDGSFALFEQLPNPPNPGLYLKNGGSIGLPLTERDAQIIVAASHAAPFGKGEETLVDDNVRKTWELSASEFEIRNSAWGTFLEGIVGKVSKGLGVGKGVGAELYKMLLYDEGAMFKPHQDSEKAPGMFATLVIALPSNHEGGEVRVTHSGQTKTFETSKFSEFDASYLAWFADVTHEVRPVLAGHRLVLTYNLIHTSLGSKELAAKSNKSMAKLRSSLSKWKEGIERDAKLPIKLAFLLEHQYTDASLCYDGLKGHDQQVAAHLREACQELGFCFYLANLERTVEGGCDEDGGYDYYHFGDFHEIVEEVDRNNILKRVVDLDGTEVEKELQFDEEHFVQMDPFEKEEPDDEDYSGFTGNEGVSATHFYHRTVALIVPRTRRMEFFITSGVEKKSYMSWIEPNETPAPRAMQWIERLTAELARDSNDDSAREDLYQICKMVIRQSKKWKNAPAPVRSWQRTPAPFSEEIVAQVVTLSVELDDKKLFLDAFDLYSIKVATETFQSVGIALLRWGLESLLPKLSTSLSTLNTLSDRLDVLDHIRAGLDMESKETSKSDAPYQDWLDAETDLALSPTVAMESEKDGTGLVSISRRLSSQDIFNKILPAVKRNSNKTTMVVAFLTGLSDPDLAGDIPEDVARTIFHDVIADLADTFSLYPLGAELAESNKKLSTPKYMLGSRPTAPTLIIDHRNSTNIATLLHRCHQLNLTTELTEITSKLVTESKTAHLDLFQGIYLPFLKHLLPFLPPKNHIDENSSPFRLLFQGILSQYIIRYVQASPPPPTDWKQSTVSCSCQDCQSLNRFLSSSSEKVGRFAVNKKRRAHLHNMLGNTGCTHETERRGSPQTLVVTKTRAAYQAKHKAWVVRCGVAKKHLGEFGMEGGGLRELLGEMYDTVMKLDVGLLETDMQSERGAGAGALKANVGAANRVLEPPTRRKVPFKVPADVIVIDD